MQSLSDCFQYPPLKDYSGLIGKTLMHSGETFLGIEVEAEAIGNNLVFPPSWIVIEDGSLKVKGAEFYTVPIKAKYLEVELNRLFSAIPNPLFSNRTSVHVHMNARDFNKEELEVFVCLYIIFEKALFKYSGGRNQNNFCVPLYMAHSYVYDLFEKLSSESFTINLLNNCHWSKYLALNLLPIWGADGVKRIGTIEFRHMKGNNDIKYILGWCNLIISLKLFAKRTSLEDLFKNYVNARNYSIAKDVFKNWIGIIDISEKEIQEGYSFLKYTR